MSLSPDDWLRQRTEDALDPALPICDPHHHLWDRDDSTYLLGDLLDDTSSGHNIVSTVFVECRAEYRDSGPASLLPIGETEFVDGVAEEAQSSCSTAVAAGIVSFADLLLGSPVEAVLAAHLEASPKRFRGIRHASGWDPSPDIRNSHTDPPAELLLDPTFRQGFAVLGRLGLSFDAWHNHTQIGELMSLAQAFPEVTIVLDHVGGPLGIGPWAGRRDEVQRQWTAAISELARCPNVVAKLGGLGMPLCGFGFHKREQPPGSEELAEAWKPYLLHCIESFGVERCMFESNFPVDKKSCSYVVLWNAFKRLTLGFSAAERAALFHDTACRVYRLRVGKE